MRALILNFAEKQQILLAWDHYKRDRWITIKDTAIYEKKLNQDHFLWNILFFLLLLQEKFRGHSDELPKNELEKNSFYLNHFSYTNHPNYHPAHSDFCTPPLNQIIKDHALNKTANLDEQTQQKIKKTRVGRVALIAAAPLCLAISVTSLPLLFVLACVGFQVGAFSAGVAVMLIILAIATCVGFLAAAIAAGNTVSTLSNKIELLKLMGAMTLLDKQLVPIPNSSLSVHGAVILNESGKSPAPIPDELIPAPAAAAATSETPAASVAPTSEPGCSYDAPRALS